MTPQQTVQAFADTFVALTKDTTDRTEGLMFTGTFAEWEQLVIAMQTLAGLTPVPERHFGEIHIVEGGDME